MSDALPKSPPSTAKPSGSKRPAAASASKPPASRASKEPSPAKSSVAPPSRTAKSNPPSQTKPKHAKAGRGHVLVVDDDHVVLESLRECLTEAGFDVDIRSQPLGTSQWIAQNDVDIVLLDLVMPAMSGADLATFLKKRGLTRRLSVILHSGKKAGELGPLVRLTGALGAIAKTSDTVSFLGEFERLAERHFRMKEGLEAPKKPAKP